MPTKFRTPLIFAPVAALAVLIDCFNPDLSMITILCSPESPDCPQGQLCNGSKCEPYLQDSGAGLADGSTADVGIASDMADAPCGLDFSKTPARRIYFVKVDSFANLKATLTRCGASCYHAYSGDNVDTSRTIPAGFYFVDAYASFLGANQSCSYFGNPVILRGFGDLAGSTKAYPACAATPAAIVADGTKSGVYCAANSATTCTAPAAVTLGVVVECK